MPMKIAIPQELRDRLDSSSRRYRAAAIGLSITLTSLLALKVPDIAAYYLYKTILLSALVVAIISALLV